MEQNWIRDEFLQRTLHHKINKRQDRLNRIPHQIYLEQGKSWKYLDPHLTLLRHQILKVGHFQRHLLGNSSDMLKNLPVVLLIIETRVLSYRLIAISMKLHCVLF